MPGTISLIGSGETASIGGQVFEAAARRYDPHLRIGVLETPAGFETNAARVANRVCSYLSTRLRSHNPRIDQIAARKKDTPLSPDSPKIVAPLYESSIIFLGPGSPTYAVRQLCDSLAWHIIQARHRLGASLVLASAATIAAGSLALPVYEIFKVGEDPHWKPGLDLFSAYGLSLIVVPHWNNREGGEDLDTSRCFIGQDRFAQLLDQVPPHMTIVGIDEHTALTVDFDACVCHVNGVGMVHIIQNGTEQVCAAGCDFPITDLGDYHPIAAPELGLPLGVWKTALEKHEQPRQHMQPPPEVHSLAAEREEARKQHDWPRADRLRQKIADLGWQVVDTAEGPLLSLNC
jgi:hypothetical protein